MNYGFYRQNGVLKYRPLPKHLLKPKKKKRKKKMGDGLYCKLGMWPDGPKINELVQPYEWGEEEDD